MKTIMTLVGTSLITNYLKEDGKEDRNLRNLYERYMLVPAKKYDDNADDIVSMKKKLSKFAQTKGSSSAELKSIRKLTQEIKETDEFAVHLLASDTINSRICAEVVRDTLASDDQIQVRFEKKHIVNGLQVTDRSRFATLGMENLFSLIESLTGGYYGYTIINITGGYKATIPYLTIFSQINRIPLYYIFEETEELIKIPLLPISVDWELFETYSEIFLSAEKNNWGIEKWDEAEKRIQKEHREIFLDMFEIDRKSNFAMVTTAGQILWKKFKPRRQMFYWNKQVREASNQDPDFDSFLGKLFEDALRKSKTEPKNGHLVLDLGRTAPRIFYRSHDGDFYVYHYTRHNDAYERFLEKPFSELNFSEFELKTIKK